MKLSALRYLVAFADEGSFSRAAARCHVSQPTLSVALQNLESDLGVTLIDRAKGHVALTDLGHQVTAQARRALDEARRVELVAQLGKDPLHGEFRLGVIHTIGPYLLPELIAAMRRTAPRMKLYIEESMTALLADYLKYGTVDAVIVALPFDLPGIETRALYDEPFRVVVPRGHAWAKRKSIAAEDVRGGDVLVLKAGNCFREQVLDACPDISHAEGSLHQGHSIETIRCMVASGYGISVLPAGAMTGPYRADLVHAIPFEAPEPARRVALAWRRGFTRLEAIEALADAVHAIDNPSYAHLPR
ncbi:MAG: LysR substrate-binding domain-containing protein [Sulfuritalea sp.]|jgi:LysR family hydrogen peroxide-inducible transcriptional activator|nr:LysR substrate-binding domain-containing protein [Sulfuritalea sp.]